MRVGRQFAPSQAWSAVRTIGAPPGSVWLAVISNACERPRHQFAVSLRRSEFRMRRLEDEPAFAPPAISVVVLVSSVTTPDVASIAAMVRTVRAISAPSRLPPTSKRRVVTLDG